MLEHTVIGKDMRCAFTEAQRQYEALKARLAVSTLLNFTDPLADTRAWANSEWGRRAEGQRAFHAKQQLTLAAPLRPW